MACSKISEPKEWNDKNPTQYVFDVSKRQLRKSLIAKIDSFRTQNWKLSFKNGDLPIDTLTIFTVPGNHSDFYLEKDHLAKRKSYLYEIDGEKLIYEADFHIHIQSIDENHTRVRIFTIKPRVIVGKNIFPSPPHFVRQFKYQEVPPSSIEEYEILLAIGKLVNQEDMPKIIYPE